MKFNKYLKSCREKYNLTQEELVQELYNFDDIFENLDINTYSRWERATTKPSSEKQISILKLFQTKSGHILSCFEDMNKENVENELCKLGIKNLIGHSKEHILDFPTRAFKIDDISVKQIKNAKDIDKVLQMPYDVIENLTGNVYNLSFDDIKKWAMHPSNFFLISEYQNRFGGILFTLQLKPNIFKKIIDFEMDLKEISIDNFTKNDEIGCNFPIAFFAYNDKSSTLLVLRYYAYLIANQEFIQSVGATPLLDGAKAMLKKMNMKSYKDKEVKQGTLTSYSASLSKMLLNKSVLKMIFQKQDCPQDISTYPKRTPTIRNSKK